MANMLGIDGSRRSDLVAMCPGWYELRRFGSLAELQDSDYA
jgi:hypothetical protein